MDEGNLSTYIVPEPPSVYLTQDSPSLMWANQQSPVRTVVSHLQATHPLTLLVLGKEQNHVLSGLAVQSAKRVWIPTP